MSAPRPSVELVRVTAVRYVRDHVLWLEFSDGVAGELDFADRLAGAVFEPLRAPSEFARVELGAETIQWPHGDETAENNSDAFFRSRPFRSRSSRSRRFRSRSSGRGLSSSP